MSDSYARQKNALEGKCFPTFIIVFAEILTLTANDFPLKPTIEAFLDCYPGTGYVLKMPFVTNREGIKFSNDKDSR